MDKLKDHDIREILLHDLYTLYGNKDDTKIINEMGILHGQSRVDIAVVNGIIHGYEIKSESDTLYRLPSQINDYNQVFDRMTIVVQRNYLDEVKQIVPKWWGILLVTRKPGQVSLRKVRKGRINKSVDPYSLSHLLWKNEALDILKAKGLQKGFLSKPRHEIYEKICESLPLDEIKTIVNQQLKKRKNWRVH